MFSVTNLYLPFGGISKREGLERSITYLDQDYLFLTLTQLLYKSVPTLSAVHSTLRPLFYLPLIYPKGQGDKQSGGGVTLPSYPLTRGFAPSY